MSSTSDFHHQIIPDPDCHWFPRDCWLVEFGIQHAHSNSVPIPGSQRVHIFSLCKGQMGRAERALATEGKHTAHIGIDWWMARCTYCPTDDAAKPVAIPCRSRTPAANK